MVILKYKSSFPPTPTKRAEESEDSVENGDEYEEGQVPRTPYIEKLMKFKKENAYEEKCDLFFICRDGEEVPAHRLVISNASKYIMAMQDDQPPWYPVYILVPDFPKDIVQTLVQLAYTGEMSMASTTTSDELFDAMQQLGWVHTDCLEATYKDLPPPPVDDDIFGGRASKTAESLETVLKMNFPVTAKEEEDEEESSDEENGMEMDLPDVPLSDDDDKLETPKKNTPSPKGRRSTRKSVKASGPEKPKPKVNASPQKKSVETKEEVVAKSDVKKRPGRKPKDESAPKEPNQPKARKAPAKPEPPEEESKPEEEVRSRTRTIRKPKKFDDDVIMMTPTKRKESPVKSSSSASSTPVKSVKASKANDDEKKKEKSVAETPEPETPKLSRNRSTSSDIKPSASASSPGLEPIDESSNEDKMPELKAEPVQNRKPSQGEEMNNFNDHDGDEEKASDNPPLKRRASARSTASNKSDKESDATNHEENSTKRKRSIDEDVITPAKRGRKPSTLSNASRSSRNSTRSSKDLDGEVDEAGSRKKRTRVE